mmetsp:Transcript_33519/g.107759  ORF Transcript_33519/g.107759 Transcript_33519/m.107759 type:complete len:195 (-) Transcript_33519:282-866(-)
MPSQPTETLVPPTRLSASKLEYSVHRPSRLLRRDIELVFRPDLEAEFQRQRPGASSDAKDGWLHEVLLAIPTWQPATQDLSEISDQVNGERRELLANFTSWSSSLRARLAPHWTDASCPLEGCAKYGTPTSVIYNELEGLTSLLKYSSVPIGCCGIVLHPEWQRCAYPVTLFTTAPPELLLAAIAETEAERGEA